MRISIIGAGSWGTSIAALLSDQNEGIRIWSRNDDVIASINENNRNALYLPDVKFTRKVYATSSVSGSVEGADVVILATPSQALRDVFSEVITCISDQTIFVSLIKGIEINTHMRMSEIITELTLEQDPTHLNILDRIAVLSGPNHAEEVSKKIPTATVIASKNIRTATAMQKLFTRDHFRIYSNPDVKGVELAGATKNIIAIAAGISDGLGFGDNTKASLLTRGLAEMTRLGGVMNARQETYYGLAGIGDLIATSTSIHSRNRGIGEEIGKGKNLKTAEEGSRMIAEGTKTVIAVKELAKELGVTLPITDAIYGVLYEGKKPEQAVSELMNRDLTSEFTWDLV